MNKVHVVVGTGPLGRSIMNELARRGERVRMISRSGRMAAVPGGVEVAAAEVSDLERLRQLTRDAGVVYNAVAPAYSGKVWETELPRMWGNILEAAASSDAKLVIGDNLYMYDQGVQTVREDNPMRSSTRKGQARIRAAERVLEAHRSGKVRATFGRGADFFGPYAADNSHLGSRVFPALLAGRPAQMIHRLDVPHTFTYVEDFGRALVVLGEREEALGGVWHVPNPPTRTPGEVLKLAAEIAGKPLEVQVMPPWMLAALGLFVPVIREVNEMLYQYREPYRVDSSKFEQTFGLEATPWEAALERTIAYFRRAAAPALRAA